MDGQYSEVVPTPNADIDSIKDAYSSNNVEGFISDVLGQRFTVGQYIFQQGVQATVTFLIPVSIISWGIHRVQEQSLVSCPRLSTSVEHFLGFGFA